ncbi:MAG TPA: hypothetical protein VMU84_17195 [Thermoanaerobaculia bacterium]|nr:hypothetical protein [Thermoanaerobaculia bacterium]
MNYEPLIERDLDAIPGVVREFRASHSAHELFLSITRFAVLAYAPSQHAKHAVLACLAAHDLREDLGDRFDDAMIECACYAAEARQPWSEPPILDPPVLDADQRGDLDELREAITDLDRLRGERWLAKRIDDADLSRDLLAIAAEDGADLGHKLIVTHAALRLAEILGEKGRYAMLRVAVWEMTAYPHEPFVARSLDEIVAQIIEERASIESAHALFRFDATLDPIVGNPQPQIPIYRLARDYAECLKMHAVVKRLRPQFPHIDFDAVLAAAKENLERSDFAEWSFA